MNAFSDKEKDLALQQALFQHYASAQLQNIGGIPFRNRQIHEQVKQSDSLRLLFDLLEKNGCFELNTEEIEWQDTDGESRRIRINRASKTHMWPMGTNFWVRDNALIASRLLHLDYDGFCYPLDWFQTGKELLLSTLTIMSSATQLNRFEAIISGETSPEDPHHWPHIFLGIDSNLNAAQDEQWMHKQDAWQIVCYCTLEALEKGFLKKEELSAKQQKLLSLICPFLKAIKFTECSNGGSWEEIEAVRSSVIAWETALLAKVLQSPDFHHPEAESLLAMGVEKLAQNLPHECPGYEPEAPQYREADAALIYLLLLEIHQFFPSEKQLEIVQQIIEQIEKLVSPWGIKRYLGDSYQGLSYYTNEVTSQLRELYDTPSGDSSGLEAFLQRSKLVPQGHEAQWTHFMWQLSSAYGKLHQSFPEQGFDKKQREYFFKGLSLVSGENELSIQENENFEMELAAVPAFRIPECYNSEVYENEIVCYPSMHTPLYWSVAECLAAFDGMLYR